MKKTDLFLLSKERIGNLSMPGLPRKPFVLPLMHWDWERSLWAYSMKKSCRCNFFVARGAGFCFDCHWMAGGKTNCAEKKVSGGIVDNRGVKNHGQKE